MPATSNSLCVTGGTHLLLHLARRTMILFSERNNVFLPAFDGEIFDVLSLSGFGTCTVTLGMLR